MASIFDVAECILENFPNGVSTRKLQKLCYFSQGWSLGLFGEEIFPEDFEAWQHGPVCRALFNSHRQKYSVSAGELIPRGSESNLTERDRAVVNAVVGNYGALSGDDLSDLTHEIGTPWDKARAKLSPNDSSNTKISKESIRDFFEKSLRTS